MPQNIENKKREDFLEILQDSESSNSKSDIKKLFITTECWLAQLGLRKKN